MFIHYYSTCFVYNLLTYTHEITVFTNTNPFQPFHQIEPTPVQICAYLKGSNIIKYY